MPSGHPEETVLALPSPRSVVPRASRVKGAWIGSSVRGLRMRNLLDRYFEQLPVEYHETVRHSAPAEWLPIDVALAHYAACDALGLLPQEVVEIGVDVVRMLYSGPLTVSAKLASSAGATPWLLFSQFQRFWERSWTGGGIGVFKLGPKEGRMEVVGFPLAQYRYIRLGMRGILMGATELFCHKAYVKETPALCTPLTLGYRISWI